MVSDEVGVAKERFIMIAARFRRLQYPLRRDRIGHSTDGDGAGVCNKDGSRESSGIIL